MGRIFERPRFRPDQFSNRKFVNMFNHHHLRVYKSSGMETDSTPDMLSLEMFLFIDSALLACVWWVSIKDPGDKIDNSLMKAKKSAS